MLSDMAVTSTVIDRPTGLTAAAVVAIGVFDGVHLGHRQVIGAAVAAARELGLPAVVWTFSPPPRQVLDPANFPGVLTTLPEKTELLGRLGIDRLVVSRFDHEVASLAPARFLREWLVPSVRPRLVLVGANFRFGAGGRGDLDLLGHELARVDSHLKVIDPFAIEGVLVSSSGIRQELASGRLGEVARRLGRPPRFTGEVTAGQRRGRSLGVPTANLRLDGSGKLLPPFGVYFVEVIRSDGSVHPAVANLGIGPTFGEGETRLEAHLLEWTGDLYGQSIGIDLLTWHRPERRFADGDELRIQIESDLAAGRQFFAMNGRGREIEWLAG